MRIILTNHARLRAAERGITFEEIVSAILDPDDSQIQDNGIFCFKKSWKENILLVYSKDEKWDWVVITVLRTSKIKKYWIR